MAWLLRRIWRTRTASSTASRPMCTSSWTWPKVPWQSGSRDSVPRSAQVRGREVEQQVLHLLGRHLRHDQGHVLLRPATLRRLSFASASLEALAVGQSEVLFRELLAHCLDLLHCCLVQTFMWTTDPFLCPHSVGCPRIQAGRSSLCSKQISALLEPD